MFLMERLGIAFDKVEWACSCGCWFSYIDKTLKPICPKCGGVDVKRVRGIKMPSLQQSV